MIGHKGEVSTIGAKEFDPRGEYKNVMGAVEEAGDGKARVYRVQMGKSRVEYWVVGLDKEEGRVVGLKVLAVES